MTIGGAGKGVRTAALWVPLSGNLLSAVLWAQCFFLPAGSSIRPMGLAIAQFGLALYTLAAGGYPAWRPWTSEDRWAGFLSGICCLTPSLLGLGTLKPAILLRSLRLADRVGGPPGCGARE
jgi:hypothetical protein